MDLLDEYTKLFRLGSKKYYNQFYIEQRQPSQQKPATPKKVRKIEPFIVALRHHRLAERLKQQELAALLQTKQSVISRFESGLTSPSLSFVARYAKAVGAVIELKVSPAEKVGED